VVLVDDQNGPPSPSETPALSQERRNELNKALHFMLAKMRCRGHTFSCFLDEASALIPVHARQDDTTAKASPAELVVNPSFRYAPRGEGPPEFGRRGPTMDGFLRGGPLVWIEDAGTGVWIPLWARGEWAEALASLRAGESAPPTLPERIRASLAAADVLVRPGSEAERRQRWETVCAEARMQFQAQGYAIVRDLIDPAHLGALRRYYRELVGGGQLPRGDDQVAERYRLHSEPVAMFFHPQLALLTNRIAGEPVKPSYVYFACYPEGSALPRHTDRLQCEFSISLQVDYSPEPRGACGWPLVLEHPDLPNGRASVDLGLGDAVFYRGRQLAHSRDPLPAGHQSSSLFFHYVRADFVGDEF
jgi:hypothetical protein